MFGKVYIKKINLLFIDELIDSGMDTAGVENSLSVLKKMGRERDKEYLSYLTQRRTYWKS